MNSLEYNFQLLLTHILNLPDSDHVPIEEISI